MTFELRAVPDGIDLVVTGDWTAATASVLREGKADGLVLNYALGFRERDLNFLNGLPVKRLEILARTVSDLSAVYSLADRLVSLKVQTDGRFSVDLERLPRLQTLAADWRQVASTIGSATGLRDCFLLAFSDIDLRAFEGLGSLQKLTMKDRPAVAFLDGVEALPALEELGIYGATRLQDLSALEIAILPRLQQLKVQGCTGISSLRFLSNCRHLAVFNAAECGAIDSLSPIKACADLELVYLYGSTRITDDDLSPLLQLPRLRQFAMQSRRSYSPTVRQVQASLTSP